MKFWHLIIPLLALSSFTVGVLAATTPTVDLVWSANTYTPAFYRGHTLVTPGSQVRTTALAVWPGKESGDLDFSWEKDGQTLTKSSGRGKDVLTFNASDTGENARVTVTVSDGLATKIQKTISIPVTNPLVSIYQDDGLLGVNYARAIGDTLALAQPEIDLLAEPYFFTAGDVSGRKMAYDWKLDGQKVVPHVENNRLITFAAPSGTKGENTVILAIKNLSNVFQDARRQFKIQFGSGQNFNF